MRRPTHVLVHEHWYCPPLCARRSDSRSLVLGQDYITAGEELLQEVSITEATRAIKGPAAGRGVGGQMPKKKFHRPKVIKSIFTKTGGKSDPALGVAP